MLTLPTLVVIIAGRVECIRRRSFSTKTTRRRWWRHPARCRSDGRYVGGLGTG